MQSSLTKAIPTGVFVVTARSRDRINGMTAAWVTQVSFKPPMVAVAIAKERYTYELISESGSFCLNTLPDGAEDLGKHFGFKSGREKDKFEAIAHTLSPKGNPILDRACAYVECLVEKTCEAGDHTLFIGKVTDCVILKDEAVPMVFNWHAFFGKKG